ncbi:hypothetical protein COM96_06450 [Bacillus cereus]|uniref:Uncharacterized protein n=1 Tax=Bacillus cereus TaxID=1396 RepID=A0A2A7I082_BACCE|nr:hypothetical protein COM96_06450 [Bacillus cereus]
MPIKSVKLILRQPFLLLIGQINEFHFEYATKNIDEMYDEVLSALKFFLSDIIIHKKFQLSEEFLKLCIVIG